MALIRRLRAEGAAGATALRGVWGYHGDHAPHGDRLLALRRHVPIVTSVVDAPAACERWLEVIAELTAETGLVTAEVVPAARVSGPGGHLEGSLSLD
jgi:PII-like signaling protein